MYTTFASLASALFARSTASLQTLEFPSAVEHRKSHQFIDADTKELGQIVQVPVVDDRSTMFNRTVVGSRDVDPVRYLLLRHLTLFFSVLS